MMLLFVLMISLGVAIYNDEFDIKQVCIDIRGIDPTNNSNLNDETQKTMDNVANPDSPLRKGTISLIDKSWIYIVDYSCSGVKTGFFIGKILHPYNYFIGKTLIFIVMVLWIFVELMSKIVKI